METRNLPLKHQVYHNRGFYYFTFIIPVTFIYASVIIFYYKNSYIPYFENIGVYLPEKRLIEAGLNICAWIMLTTLLTTDGAIQARNHKVNLVLKKSKNDFKYNIIRFFTCIFAGLTFLSCIAYGSILISDSITYYYLCGCFFLISTSLYFLLVNIMFVMVKMNTKKEVEITDTSNINLFDWIHAVSAPIFFICSYFMKSKFIFIQNDNINDIVSKALQYSGITLLFLNFVRIVLRMPIINIFLVYKKKE